MKKIDFTLKNEKQLLNWFFFFGRKDLCVLVAARKIDITFLGLLNWNAKKNEILMRSSASPSSTFAIIIRAVGTGGSDPPPDCGRSVYPIPNGWADYAHNITACNSRIFRPSYRSELLLYVVFLKGRRRSLWLIWLWKKISNRSKYWDLCLMHQKLRM